jgi:hypothetical protein
MELFEYSNWKLDIRPEAFTIKAFADLINRDKSRDKGRAIKELAFVFHMCDFSSPFSSYLDQETKKRDIVKKIGLPNDWEPDGLVNEAIRVYRELEETTTSRYYESAKIALSKIDAYFRTFEITPDTSAAEVQKVESMIKSSVETVKSLRSLEEIVKQDKERNERIRGGKERPYFDD